MINVTVTLAGIFIVACCVILTRARMYSVRRAMNLPKQADCGEKEAEECAKNISLFLAERAKMCGIYIHNMEGQAGVTYDELHRIMIGKDESILALIRISQALGCEISVREKSIDGNRDNI